MAINRTKIKRQLYANGGLGQLVDREKFGIGSKFKKVFKKATKPVVKIAQKLVPKEIAGPLMMAAPFLGPVYGPIAYAAGSAKKTGRIDPVKLALVAAPYVKFQGGEGIGAFKPVGYGGSKYGVFGGEEVMYDFPTSGTTASVPSTYTPSGQVPEASEGAISRTYSEPTTVTTVGGGDPGVIVPQVSTPTKPVSLADVAGKYFEEPLKVLKTKEFPEGRSLRDLVVSTATKPETIIGAGVGLAQYIEAKKQELEDQGQEFDREAYENTVNEYYSKFSKSFERGFSNQGGLSQLAPRKKYGGGMSDNRVSQLLLLREEAMTNGDDDKVAELDQELDLILRPGKEDGTTEEDIVSMTDEGRSGVIYMTPDGKQIDKETFFNMTDQEENDEEDTEEETQSMMTPIMPQPKPSFMQPNAIVAPILEAESQEYIKQNLGKKDGGRIGFKNGTKKKDEDKEDDIDAQVEKEIKEETPRSYDFMIGLSPLTYARKYLKKKEIEKRDNKANGGIMQARKQYALGGGFYDNYINYLNQFQNANLNPVEQIKPTPMPIGLMYSGDADESETTPTPTGTGKAKISDVLGFLASPVGFTINQAIGKVVGKTPVQMIQDRISSFADSFGGGNAGETAGTAADPSTAASEDPGAIGSQSPGGSESGGSSDGAAAASAAGANDGPDTGGSFAKGGRVSFSDGSDPIIPFEKIKLFELVGEELYGDWDSFSEVYDDYGADRMWKGIPGRPANKKDGGRIGMQTGGFSTYQGILPGYQYNQSTNQYMNPSGNIIGRNSYYNAIAAYNQNQTQPTNASTAQTLKSLGTIPLTGLQGLFGVGSGTRTKAMEENLANIIRQKGTLEGNIGYEDYGLPVSSKGGRFTGLGSALTKDPVAVANALTIGRASYKVDPSTGKVSFGSTDYDFNVGQDKGFAANFLRGVNMGGVKGAVTGDRTPVQIKPNVQVDPEYLRNRIMQSQADAAARVPVKKKNGGRIGYMEGGIKSVPIRTNQAGTKELDYRAKGGFVPIGVKERADDVPAMLSKNEFVFTADAVRGAGGGNINKGARKMYNLMKNLETRRT